MMCIGRRIKRALFSGRCAYPLAAVLLVCLPGIIKAQNVFFDSSATVISPANAPVAGGDTIFLEAGTYRFLLIQSIQGNHHEPVVITNRNGEVIINSDHHYGISMRNCKHVRLTGQTKYGIRITRVENGNGIGVSALSNHIEIDHLEITNVSHAGIMCKTDPDCTFQATRDSFLMQNIHIHHNLIHNVGTEGLYIGNTRFSGLVMNCQGKDTLLFPHLIHDLSVHDNIIKYTGWDGLQVSSATQNCAIFNNVISYDSQKEQNFQMSGILMGGGSSCDCYNNWIFKGKGNGIEYHGTGGQRIFNNVIIQPGYQYFPYDPTIPIHGMLFSHHAFLYPDSGVRVFNNTIVHPKSDGIRFNFSSLKSAGNMVKNNIIVEPGAYAYYEDLSTFRTGEDAYVFKNDTALDVTISHNIFTRNKSSVNFYDVYNHNYTLNHGSPAINQGVDLTAHHIVFDHYFTPRPQGSGFDIGAFEFDSLRVAKNELLRSHQVSIFPNPAKHFFILNAPAALYQITIFSLHGKEMVTKKGVHPHVPVYVNSLKPGMYLLLIENSSDNKSYVQKLIIQ